MRMERVIPMNVTGVSGAGCAIDVAGAQASQAGAAYKVLNMAMDVFEDAAAQLIASMSDITGIGQNIDITV